MIKNGMIAPGTTPDVEQRVPPEKVASANREKVAQALDDDITKRMADRAAQGLKPEKD